MILSKRIRLLCAGLALTALVACDNAEERAQGHYKRGLELVEAGEIDKAVLEFKNALQLNTEALEPRLEFARLMMLQNNFDGAIGNYLKVIDLDPAMLEPRLVVGRLLLGAGHEDAAEHINEALKIAPDDIEARGLSAALLQTQGDLEKAAEVATKLLEDSPGQADATMVLVEQSRVDGDHQTTLRLLDAALAETPDNFRLQFTKLQELEKADDQPAIGAQLEAMAELFPDNPQIAQGQVQWYLNQSDIEGAVRAQRAVAGLFPDDPSHALNVAALLNQYEGQEAARAELQALTEGDAHKTTYIRAMADFEVQVGEADAAIARLQALRDSGLPEAEEHEVEAQLANILRATGDPEAAQAIADEVLAEDANDVEALKLRALYAIDDDRPQDAITDLRTALGLRAQDPAILSMLALAHERNGSIGLAQERLALAVQASGTGVAETLRYAEFLTRQGKGAIALEALNDALSKRGDVLELLVGLAQVQIQQSDWAGANTTARKIELLGGTDQAEAIASEIRLASLSGQKKFEESIGILREMWDVAGERTTAMENLVRSYVQTGKTEEAKDFLDNILADEPRNLRANLLRGAIDAFEGDLETAETRYRKVVADHPDRENGYGALASILTSQGRLEEADAVIQDGIKNAENTERLLFARAGRLELEGDYEGAIAIYEQLYAANKVSDVLANNLASLLSEFRSDPESLERAFNIAKRLRSSDEPAFQDTYGWILYKRGEYERALQPLTAAAQGVRNNVFVQYHLGMVYEKLGQKDKAIEQLTRAVELGEGSSLPILEEARSVLERLTSE